MEGASEGAVYVDLSTNSPSSARRIYQEFQSRGVAALDAPVSGGVPGAEAATLSIMVGGDRDIFEKVSPVLRSIGDKLIYCGPPGSGMVCKICNNLVTMSLAAFLPEVLTLGVEAGVDLKLSPRPLPVAPAATGSWRANSQPPYFRETSTQASP